MILFKFGEDYYPFINFDSVTMPIVRRITAQLIGLDLVSGQPMSEPWGIDHVSVIITFKKKFKFGE